MGYFTMHVHSFKIDPIVPSLLAYLDREPSPWSPPLSSSSHVSSYIHLRHFPPPPAPRINLLLYMSLPRPNNYPVTSPRSRPPYSLSLPSIPLHSTILLPSSPPEVLPTNLPPSRPARARTLSASAASPRATLTNALRLALRTLQFHP